MNSKDCLKCGKSRFDCLYCEQDRQEGINFRLRGHKSYNLHQKYKILVLECVTGNMWKCISGFTWAQMRLVICRLAEFSYSFPVQFSYSFRTVFLCVSYSI